jgi:hypothetical protein
MAVPELEKTPQGFELQFGTNFLGHFALAIYLDDFDVDAETNRILDVALEMTRAALGLTDDFANGIIARQIIELVRAGERNPDLLRDGALKKLRGALFGD